MIYIYIYPTYSYPLVHSKHPHSIIPVDVVSSFPSMVPGTVARRATTRREQQVLPFVEPQSGREVAPCATKGMGLLGGNVWIFHNFPSYEKDWKSMGSWATPRFGTLALLLKCVDNPKVWDVDVVFFCAEWCGMGGARTLDCSEERSVGKVFLSGKEGWYAAFVSVLLALFYGPVGPLLRAWHDGEVLIASVHFNPQSVEKATSVAQLHSESWLVVASGSIAAEWLVRKQQPRRPSTTKWF